MTNPEINKRIAELYLPCDYLLTKGVVELISTVTKLGAHGEPHEVIEKYGEFNPCENWNQLMPLVVDNKLCLNFEPHDGEYCAESFADSYQHENPQIALCMCLIKVLAAEKESK